MIFTGGKWFLLLLHWSMTTCISGLIVRLPEIISPIHYRLSLIPILEKEPRLCGYALIEIVPHTRTRTIVLNAAELAVHRIVVHPLTNSPFIYQTVHREEKGDKLAEELYEYVMKLKSSLLL